MARWVMHQAPNSSQGLTHTSSGQRETHAQRKCVCLNTVRVQGWTRILTLGSGQVCVISSTTELICSLSQTRKVWFTQIGTNHFKSVSWKCALFLLWHLFRVYRKSKSALRETFKRRQNTEPGERVQNSLNLFTFSSITTKNCGVFYWAFVCQNVSEIQNYKRKIYMEVKHKKHLVYWFYL